MTNLGMPTVPPQTRTELTGGFGYAFNGAATTGRAPSPSASASASLGVPWRTGAGPLDRSAGRRPALTWFVNRDGDGDGDGKTVRATMRQGRAVMARVLM